MQRIKLRLPEHFIFTTEIPTRIIDVNHGGHIGNDRLLSLVQEARTQFFYSLGYTETDIEGMGILVVDAALQYLHQIYYPDLLRIEVAIDVEGLVGLDMFYKIGSRELGKTVAKAKTAIVFFDYVAEKINKTPEAFLEKVNQPGRQSA